uniref:Uncharacterized protein n=1 Tax=Panagrolaimus sp. PS1159 TaxID=55785 RepID=A0AC35GX58_9BILA
MTLMTQNSFHNFKIEDENPKSSKWYHLATKKRWILGFVLLFGNFCAVSMRTNLGVAMVCMINATAVQQQHQHLSPEISLIPLNEPPQNSQCHRIIVNETHSIKSGYKGTFTWTTEEQSLLFTASFYGNLLSLAFAGFLI